MNQIPQATLSLLLLPFLAGCASGPSDSLKLQPHFLAGVPRERAIGLLPVLVSSQQKRAEKSRHLDRSIPAALRASKLFKRITPTTRRRGSFDVLLQVDVTDGRLLRAPRSNTALNLLTLGLYSLLGGELDRYEMRVAHRVRIWEGSRKIGEFTVVNVYSAPLTLYTSVAEYERAHAALSLTPQIVLERLAFALAQ